MDFNNFDDFVICYHEDVRFMNRELKYKICLLTVILFYVVTVKSMVEISQNFVAFSEYVNFRISNIT